MDALRAIAALSVFAGHTITGTTGLLAHRTLFVWATNLAYEGVAIFFLVSGFLLYRPFLVARRGGRRMSLTGYVRRRLLRIVPAYWAALSIFLALGLVTGVTASNWWIFYGFGQVYRFATIGSGIGAAWTLCIEVTFYAALPVFAWVTARLAAGTRSLRGDVALLAVLGAASLVFRAHFSAFADLATVSTLLGTFLWFALGMGLAVASVDDRVWPAAARWAVRRPGWPVGAWLVALVLFAAAHAVVSAAPTLGATTAAVTQHALYGLVALCVLAPAVFAEHEDGVVTRILRARVLAWVGLVSYAFYLYHPIVIARLARLVAGHGLALRWLFVAPAALAVSLACAAASFYVLERPLMRIGARSLRSGVRTGRAAAD
jgi:peptidoglycan/LPS O-acetylase OafA/YrhL